MSIPRIEVLESSVVDRIAAGEVVERPSHLVKELVENSLDAGATEIQIDIQNGGRHVSVTDNGRGIHPEDLGKALSRHATSKIKSSDDLWKLSSYGFRGEALASIASVAKLSISSRPLAQDLGHQVISEFGNLSPAEQIGHAPGTRVQVAELFQNVPARLKFLKSPAAEVSQIKSVIKAMALSHEHCAFRLSIDAQLEFLWSQAKSRKERVQAILGAEIMYTHSAERSEGEVKVVAHAVYCDPHHVAKTSKNIWLFAQNRWVQDRGLQAAVQEAYKNLLMHGEYPICAVWVETSPENIDVNIHPTKSQVKFVDPSLAFRAVRGALREGLEQAPWLAQSVVGTAKIQRLAQPQGPAASTSQPALPQKSFDFSPEGQAGRTQYKQKVSLSQLQEMGIVRTGLFESLPETLQDASQDSVKSFITNSGVAAEPEIQTPRAKIWSSLQYLGQSHLTYLICQSEEGLVLIDQHAAHERVQFERLTQAFRSNSSGSLDKVLEVQEFLFPQTLALSAENAEALLKHRLDFLKLGIRLESDSDTVIGIYSAPASLKESAVLKALEKAAHEFSELGGSGQVETVIADFCASAACHSAIRAGQALSPDEARALLEKMDEFPLSSFCPHGRPVSIKFTSAFLEKEFGRRV
jgi:DNA mismatch repair protein MutL